MVLRAAFRGTDLISSKPKLPLWRQTITDRRNVSAGKKAVLVARRGHADERELIADILQSQGGNGRADARSGSALRFILL